MLVEVKNLRIEFAFEGRVSVPVRGVSFKVPEHGRVALVGESGCGKSLTSLALGGLVDRARITGEIVGRPRIAYVFQNPMQSLDPVMKVGAQIEEGMHGRPSREERRRCVAELLESVGLPADAARKYPCELSGGQQQRVMIASALAQDPELMVADEPTTALDVTTQKEVLDLVGRIADERKMAVLLIRRLFGRGLRDVRRRGGRGGPGRGSARQPAAPLHPGAARRGAAARCAARRATRGHPGHGAAAVGLAEWLRVPSALPEGGPLLRGGGTEMQSAAKYGIIAA